MITYEIWDGFDHYDAAHDPWPTVSGTPLYSTSYARFPAAPNCVGRGLACGTSVAKRWNLSGNRSGLVFSFAFGISSLSFAGYENFMNFQDLGVNQSLLAVSSAGALVVRNGAAGAVIGTTATGVISPSSTPVYFLDVVIGFGSSTGTFAVYLNTPFGGAPLLSLTGLNTINTANAYANQFSIGELTGNTLTLYFDDFHCNSFTGSPAVLGEGTRIYTKMPGGAGYATVFTPNGAAANWQCVDEVPPDGDTSYVSTASFPATEGYAVGAAGLNNTVNGVVRYSYVRKDDAGAHTFSNGVRSGGINGFSTAGSVNSAYSWQQNVFLTDPNTGLGWTAANADAASPVISAVT